MQIFHAIANLTFKQRIHLWWALILLFLVTYSNSNKIAQVHIHVFLIQSNMVAKSKIALSNSVILYNNMLFNGVS